MKGQGGSFLKGKIFLLPLSLERAGFPVTFARQTPDRQEGFGFCPRKEPNPPVSIRPARATT